MRGWAKSIRLQWVSLWKHCQGFTGILICMAVPCIAALWFLCASCKNFSEILGGFQIEVFPTLWGLGWLNKLLLSPSYWHKAHSALPAEARKAVRCWKVGKLLCCIQWQQNRKTYRRTGYTLSRSFSFPYIFLLDHQWGPEPLFGQWNSLRTFLSNKIFWGHCYRFVADFCASADCGWVHWALVSLCPLHCLSALLMA